MQEETSQLRQETRLFNQTSHHSFLLYKMHKLRRQQTLSCCLQLSSNLQPKKLSYPLFNHFKEYRKTLLECHALARYVSLTSLKFVRESLCYAHRQSSFGVHDFLKKSTRSCLVNLAPSPFAADFPFAVLSAIIAPSFIRTRTSSSPLGMSFNLFWRRVFHLENESLRFFLRT